MKLRTLAIATTIGLVAALTVASMAAADEGGGNGGGRRLSATLTGAAEVPGPGDLDGTGTVALTMRPGHNEVCFDIHVSGIALPATAAHIHQGQVGVAGGIVVTLGTPDAAGNASGCVSASHDLLKAIRQNPSAYYVNVHTTDFPNGALRGQLARRSGQSQGQGQGSRTFQVSLKGRTRFPDRETQTAADPPRSTSTALSTKCASRSTSPVSCFQRLALMSIRELEESRDRSSSRSHRPMAPARRAVALR